MSEIKLYEYVGYDAARAAYFRGDRVETPRRENAAILEWAPIQVAIPLSIDDWLSNCCAEANTWHYRIVREVPEADTPEVAPASPAYRMRLLRLERCIQDVEATYAVVGKLPLEIDGPTPDVEALRRDVVAHVERADKAMKECAALKDELAKVKAELALVRIQLDSAKAVARREQNAYRVIREAQIADTEALSNLRDQLRRLADAS